MCDLADFAQDALPDLTSHSSGSGTIDIFSFHQHTNNLNLSLRFARFFRV